MWAIVFVIVWATLVAVAWVLCATAGDADDRMMRRYQAERRAFEDLFE